MSNSVILHLCHEKPQHEHCERVFLFHEGVVLLQEILSLGRKDLERYHTKKTILYCNPSNTKKYETNEIGKL